MLWGLRFDKTYQTHVACFPAEKNCSRILIFMNINDKINISIIANITIFNIFKYPTYTRPLLFGGPGWWSNSQFCLGWFVNEGSDPEEA